MTPTLFAQKVIKSALNTIKYSIKDGLPSNETYDVFQDSKGFIWIGTDNGVVKYDGSNFKTYTILDGLTDNTIFKINEDHHGRIWFMTYNRKLCYYLNGEFFPYRFNKELEDALRNIGMNEIITHFYLDKKDNIQLCLINFTKVKITPRGKVKIEDQEKDSSYTSFHFPGVELIDVYNIILPEISKAKRHNKFIIQNKHWGNLHFFAKDSVTYLGTSKGLKYIPIGSNKISRSILEEYYVTGVQSDFEGGLWCSTLKSGILYISNPNISFCKTDGRKSEFIQALVPQNDLLVITMNKASNSNLYLDKENKQLKTYRPNLAGSKIPYRNLSQGLKFENHVMFENIGSPILSVLNIPKEVPNYFTNYSILQQGIISTDDYNKMDLANSVLKKNIRGEEWIALPEKLLVIKKSNPQISNSATIYPSDFKVLKPLRTSTGQILLATTNGLYFLNEENRTIHPFPEFHKFTKQRIQDIIETNDGSLVFATKANGIYIWKDSLTVHYTIKEGLLSNTINQLAYDSISNTIWAATNNGLSRLTKSIKNKWTPHSIITKYDGLKSQDIRSLYFYKNYLVFTNNMGLYFIEKQKLQVDSVSPYLYTKEFSVNTISKKQENLMGLPYDSNNISLTFQSVSYKTSSSIVYKYQLLPNDSLWQESKSNQLNFNALPPGDYTLHVKSQNFHGLTSKTQTVNFSIIPAFWMTTWFYLLVVSLIILVVIIIFSYIIQMYKNQAKFQRSLKEMHVVSLQSKMNPHFIFNSLNSIQNYILKNEKIKANEYLLEFSTLIRAILQNSESTSISLKKELSTLKLYVNLEKKRIRKDFIYWEEIDSNINENACVIPTLLIQPYIENAIWHGQVHTNPRGEISVKIVRNDRILLFEIQDNGIGIENAEKSKVKNNGHKSIGSDATKKRIQLLSELNNEITAVKITALYPNETQFTGTKITFSVPYKESNKSENL